VDERLRRYDHLTDVLHAAIIRYTNAANMDVVARILTLPRELRDNIYMQLWQPDEKHDPTRSVICWWELFHEPWFSIDHDPDTPAGLSMLYMNLRPQVIAYVRTACETNTDFVHPSLGLISSTRLS